MRTPIDREVAVGIEPEQRRRKRDAAAIPVLDRALREEEVVIAAGLVRRAPDHDPRILIPRLPRSGRVLEPHQGDQAVAVDVLLDQTVLLLRVRERADRRADIARAAGENPLHAVDVDRRDDIGSRLGQQPRDRGIGFGIGQDMVEQPEDRRDARHLAGMNVGVDIIRGLGVLRAGGLVGQSQRPDVAPLVGRADALDREEIRVFRDPAMEQLGQVVIAVVAIGPVLARLGDPFSRRKRHQA